MANKIKNKNKVFFSRKRRLSAFKLALLSLFFFGYVFSSTVIAGKEGEAAAFWAELKYDIFEDHKILDGAMLLSLETPLRAHDAALVPIKIHALQPQSEKKYIKSITLIIDKNPVPVAAVFHLSRESGLASLSTRVRINEYSHVRAVAELNDGSLHMVAQFVKAAGGCSAPAGKDPDESLANLGKMKLRQYTPVPQAKAISSSLREAQLMIRHPNSSGLQVDQLTGYYIPAHFVRMIEVWKGKKRVLAVEGAISLSEDPTIRFHFLEGQGKQLEVQVIDTEEYKFSKTWEIQPRAKGSSS